MKYPNRTLFDFWSYFGQTRENVQSPSEPSHDQRTEDTRQSVYTLKRVVLRIFYDRLRRIYEGFTKFDVKMATYLFV